MANNNGFVPLVNEGEDNINRNNNNGNVPVAVAGPQIVQPQPRQVRMLEDVLTQNGFSMWQVGICETPFKDCSLFCSNFWCCCCKVHEQRELTVDDGTHLRCLDQGGPGTYFPCDSCKDTCVCPKNPCMFFETLCCTFNSLLVTRRRMIHHFKLRNSDCDDFAFNVLRVSSNTRELGICSALIGCVCISCMLTQQKLELDARGGFPRFTPPPPPPHHVMAVPMVPMPLAQPVQQQQQQYHQQQQLQFYAQQPHLQQQQPYLQYPAQQIYNQPLPQQQQRPAYDSSLPSAPVAPYSVYPSVYAQRPQ